MADPKSLRIRPQSSDLAARKSGAKRNRRLTDLMPELRSRIRPMFDLGVSVERIAEDFEVAPLQLLEHVVREYSGARHPGVARRPNQPETAVRSFRTVRLSA